MFQKIRTFFAPKDMTNGNILHDLLRFSIPLIIGNFAQQLYSTVDAVIVGRVVPGGIAAIGSTFPVINFSILLFMAIATGAGVMVAQYFGAKDQTNLTKTVGNTLMLILIATIVLTSILIPLAGPFLNLISTPSEIHGMATEYLQITFLGFLGAAFFNIGSGILRGVGDSVTPLFYLLISTIINTILDIIFVWYWDWGVAGAAWATITAQAISAVLCLIQIFRTPLIGKLHKRDLKPDLSLVKNLIRLGLPAGITQGLFSLAMIMVQNLVNTMGTMVIEANTIVMRLDGFAMLPNQTFGVAATTFIGQNIGAKKMDRVREGAKIVSKLAFFVSLSLAVILLLIGKQAFSLFTANQDIINLSYRMMMILAIGYVAVSQTSSLGGVMRGAGDTITPMWIALFTTILLRVPLAYLLAYLTRSDVWPNGSPFTLNISLLIGWVTSAIVSYVFYRRGKWKNKAIV